MLSLHTKFTSISTDRCNPELRRV